jgi:hypothetical protein
MMDEDGPGAVAVAVVGDEDRLAGAALGEEGGVDQIESASVGRCGAENLPAGSSRPLSP